jgi:hypothetical protein
MAQAIASQARMPVGCGRTHGSRFSGRLSVLDAVAVMDGLVRTESRTQQLFHHEDVFEDVRAVGSGSWMVRHT